MNAIHFEAVIYALQIVSFFLIAGPAMLRIERRQTLARNPSWIASQPRFLEAHGEVDLRYLRLATLVLVSLLGAAAATSSRPWMFVVHTPLFLAFFLGFYVYYDRLEKRLRVSIPEDPVRKATWSPRRLRAFLPAWALWGLAGAVLAIISLNAWGQAAGHIERSRALANGSVVSLLAVGLGLLLRRVLQRASYRMSQESDSSGRSMELSLVLGTAAFFALVCLYHSLGSLGPSPLFAFPPTQLHSLIESRPWSWSIFFARAEYRWVELGTALFIALIGPWLARSPFTRRLLTTDPRKIHSAFEV